VPRCYDFSVMVFLDSHVYCGFLGNTAMGTRLRSADPWQELATLRTKLYVVSSYHEVVAPRITRRQGNRNAQEIIAVKNSNLT
jgi:hypothetical protein